MFYLYLSISCVSCWCFHVSLSVLVFHVPMAMLSLPHILNGAPTACLTPPSCVQLRARSLLSREATDPVWSAFWLSFHGDSRARYNLTEPIPLQVERAAVEFVMEPFNPSGMKTSAQWCRVDTSYFTRNWETRGGRERLILSNSGPKDLPTAQKQYTATTNVPRE